MSTIKILHFSDFHLDAKHEKEAEQLVSKMIGAIRKDGIVVDLIIFSGDMIDKGGAGYGDIMKAFAKFKEIVIDKLISSLDLSPDRFIFTFGNHDSLIKPRDEATDMAIDAKLTSEKNILDFKGANDADPYYLDRQKSARKFRDTYYKNALPKESLEITPFQANFKLDINGIKVGITSLNTSWRCSKNDKGKLVLGLWQIIDSEKFISDCDFKIAVGHHHPIAMKEFEQKDFSIMLSKHYDLYLCGHTHSPYIELRKPSGWLMDVTASGMLNANIYEDNSEYKNGFQIIEIDTSKRDFDIIEYTQKGYDDFSVSNIRHEHIPNDQDDAKIIMKAEQRAQKAEAMLNSFVKKSVLAPFIPLDDFIKFFECKYEFISNAIIDQIISRLQTAQDEIRFLALSGMGKTRIIWEAFKDSKIPNVYYTASHVESGDVQRILNMYQGEEGILILDNCPIDNLRIVESEVRQWNSNFRIISIYNELSREQELYNGNVITLDYKQTGDIVDKILIKDPYLNTLEKKEAVISLIKYYSGDIPFMAFLLIDTYRKYGDVLLRNANDVLPKLLGDPTKDEIKVLRAISIFKLLGYFGDYQKEFEVVKSDINIHHIERLREDQIDYIFNQTIEKYHRQQLIEFLTYWINVRPQPLAEWLVDGWFSETDSISLLKMFDYISQNPNSGNLLKEFCKRIEEMGDSKREKEIMEKALLPKYGPFFNESIVISSQGSRLILSMAHVNPEAVANCLYLLLKDKDSSFITEKIVKEVRWNLTEALQKCCIFRERFVEAAFILAKLAITDTKPYVNEARNNFLQLFHIVLSGTQSTIEQRISVLQMVEELGEEYYELIVDAVSNAIYTEDLFISKSSYKVGGKEYKEHKITSQDEIIEYWRGCLGVMLDVLAKKKDLIPMALDKLATNVKDFTNTHTVEVLDEFLSKLYDIEKFGCLKMRDNIHYLLNVRYNKNLSDSEKAMLGKWEATLTPKDFISRLNFAYKFRALEVKEDDFAKKLELIYGLMLPYAEEFLTQHLYNTSVLEDLMDNKNFIDSMFCRGLANKLTEKKMGAEFAKAAFDVIERKDKSYTSAFLLSVCGFSSKEIWVKNMEETLYSCGYYNLALSCLGLISDDKLSGFDGVLMDIKCGKYPNTLINNFLREYRCNKVDNIISIIEKLKDKDYIDRYEVLYPFIINYALLFPQDSVENKSHLWLKLVPILIDYDFSRNDNQAFTILSLLSDYFEKSNDEKAAVLFNRKVISTLNQGLGDGRQYEHIYFSLLPKYQDALLNDILAALSMPLGKSGFYDEMYTYLGSGFGTGAGPLFQCDNKRLEEACENNPDVLPARLALMCPVYHWEKGKILGFGDFFLWLIERFPNDKRIVDMFSSNFGSYSWSGVGTMENFFQQRVDILKDFAQKTNNKYARTWALREVEINFRQKNRERSNAEWEDNMF